MSLTLHIINGPNLNLLGQREPEIYGSTTLSDIEQNCREAFPDTQIDFFQSNIEGELVTLIQEAGSNADAIVINPAAYTHTSVAIHDAIKAVGIPTVEIHLSQRAARESFRRRSLVSEAETGTISGFGAHSYLLGLQAAIKLAKADG